MAEKVFLVDGSGYIFRAFFGIQRLTTKSGFPTNALFGFCRMFLRLLTDAGARHVAVAFDTKAKTFRHDLYVEYKANRTAPPDELVQQMPYFRDLVRALGIPVLELAGYEADDLIGTISTRLAAEGSEVVIVSADKDLMQLVGPTVSIWDTMKDQRFGAAEVKEKLGVPPELVVDYLGLCGDSSDNIPGLDGVGPKTAVQLLEKFGSIDRILESPAEIRAWSALRNRNKIADLVESDADTLRLSRRLAEIHTQVPLVLDGLEPRTVDQLSAEELVAALTRGPLLQEKLVELRDQFEFESLFKEFKLDAAQDFKSTDGFRYETIYRDEFDGWLDRLVAQERFAFDIETTSLDVLDAQIVGLSFCWEDDRAYYVPIGHVLPPEGKEQVSLELLLETLGIVFRNPAIRKIGQNLKYDVGVLARHGVAVRGVAFDTMLAAYVLHSDRRAFNLTALSNEHLGLPVTEFDDVAGPGGDFSATKIDEASRYACQDAHYAWLLEGILAPRLEEQGLLHVFDEIEMPLVTVLSGMERAGILVDGEMLRRLSAEFSEILDRITVELHTLAGGEFNINSPKQLGEILFDRLGLPTKGLKKTKTGISTDSTVLEKLAKLHPLPDLILRYRMLYKLKTTYADALVLQVSPITGRLHTKFNQTVTATGRLSSSDPNLQNIPIQTAEGRRIREAFVAPEGSVLISADYSQIELRLLAHLSGDESLIGAFVADRDIHAQTAREIFRLGEGDDVSDDQRRVGKTINFGLVYGMGPYRLSQELGIPMGVAVGYIEEYFSRYPGVKKFFGELEEHAERTGVVQTIFGRKRVLSDIDSSGRDQGFVLRAALNAPIQGSAADIIKIAMNRLVTRFEKEGLPVTMLLQIHDELVFECASDLRERATAIIVQEMEQAVTLKVPLKVSVGSGANWQEAQS